MTISHRKPARLLGILCHWFAGLVVLVGFIGLLIVDTAFAQAAQNTQDILGKGRIIFASVKAPARVRVGPGLIYPTRYRIAAPWFPVQIVERYDNWRKIRHPSETGWAEGWTHSSNISVRHRMVLMTDKKRQALYRRPDDDSRARGWMERGGAARLVRCPAPKKTDEETSAKTGAKMDAKTVGKKTDKKMEKTIWCLIRQGNIRGWIKQKYLWGINAQQVYDP